MSSPASTCIATLLLALTPLAMCQTQPEPRYGIKEDTSRTGSNIRRNQFSSPAVALNLPYDQLPEADKRALHSWWEPMQQGDEPPFPSEGLQALYGPVRKASNALHDLGQLYAIATVEKDGNVSQARVLSSPSTQMADFTAKLLLLTKFKPAICNDQPCRMDFPLQVRFTAAK
jgi:hypothetical protein